MKRLLFILLVSGVWLLVFPNSYAMVDSNENDMSDLWEKKYNSNQLFAPSFLPLDDADGDSVSNLDESLAGTDPKDGKPPDGFLQTEVIHSPAVYINGDNGPEVFTPEAFSISWVTVRGKRYTLLHSPDLSAGSWIPIGEQILGYGYGITIPVAPTQTGDGIPDKLFWRVAVGDLDSDGDGFNDYEEYALNTNPYIADRDGDGLPDEWEVAYDLDLDDNGTLDSSKGPNGDLDGDLLTNLEEYYYNGDPRDADTDDDHLGDRSEAYDYYTYVDLADSDSDGLDDGEEILRTIPTDPWDWDSDNDTLSDGAEVNTHGTNPSHKDTDGDTLRDDWEIRYVFNPLESADGPTDPDGDGLKNPIEQLLRLHPRDNDTNNNETLDGAEDSDKDNLTNLSEVSINPTNPTDPSKHDTDGDGLPDGWERLYFLDPKDTVGSNGRHGDPDGDLLENFDEYLNSTSPILASSDGNDGANDYQEVLLGTDPNAFSDGGGWGGGGGGGGGGFISPSDPVEEATFRVGGDYASWRMEVKGLGPRDHRKLLAVSPQYNEWNDQLHKLRINNQYEITMHHTGSRPQDDPPWYCWEAGMTSSSPTPLPLASLGSMLAQNSHDLIASFASSSGYYGEFFMFGIGNRWLVDNREGVIAGHTHSKGVNRIEGKKAQAIPVAIKDNEEATGVDVTSIDADPSDIGQQDDYWIMAPSGVVPPGVSGAGTDCSNDMHFVIPLNPQADLKIETQHATPTPTTVTLRPTQVAAPTDPLCSWHGTSTETQDETPVFKVGTNEVAVDLPIRVKTMKNRTLKISVFPVKKSASSAAIVIPDKAALTAKLHRVLGYQINAWALEPVYKPEQIFNYDPDTNGILDWPSTVHEQLEALCIDNTADLVVTLIGDVAYVVGGEAAYGSAPPGEGAVIVATSKPLTVTNLAILEPVPPARVINTMIHEMGHRIVGLGHPNQGGGGTGVDGGVAPLVGTDRTRRLMASGGHRADDGYLLVKKEWDAAETWMNNNVIP